MSDTQPTHFFEFLFADRSEVVRSVDRLVFQRVEKYIEFGLRGGVLMEKLADPEWPSLPFRLALVKVFDDKKTSRRFYFAERS